MGMHANILKLIQKSHVRGPGILLDISYRTSAGLGVWILGRADFPGR